jgi:uncharacterized membrane protein
MGFFFWVGSWGSMSGRSSHEVEVDLPEILAFAALCVLGFGLWHERAFERRGSQFYVVYQALALLYLNGALLILSLNDTHDVAAYTLLVTVAAIAQIVVGAWLQNSLFLAFGITTAALDLVTRYFETYWDKLDRGAFFLAGGAVLFAFGYVFEQIARNRRAKVSA